jgi:hypothetical protein
LLNGELVCPWVAVADELHGAGVGDLLRVAHRLLQDRRRRLVQNPQLATRPLVDLDPIQAGVLVHADRAQGSDLYRLQWVDADAVLARQLRCGDELLD